jgi:hypothetical protein
MKKYIFFPMLLALSFIACDPKPTPVNPTTKVEGTLMDRGTNIPIPNTVVKLVEVGGSILSPTTSFIQSATTNDKGQYTFTFEWTDDSKGYGLDTRPKDLNQYYDLPKVVGRVERGQTNKVDCFLNPYGWVKYRVKNSNPFDDRDTISCVAGTYIGRNVDKTIVIRHLKIWEKPDSVGWIVIKNKIETRYVKPIALSPKDTIDYDINY